MKNETQDLIIIGGGIMGLMTAYYASNFVKNVTILEKNAIGKKNRESASFSYTRSIRVDYLEPFYANLAYEAQMLWLEFEKEWSTELFVKCGCLNIAKKSITPDLSETYAEMSYLTGKKLNYQPEKLNREALQKRFGQFDADFATLDMKGGYLLPQNALKFLFKTLKNKNISLRENVGIISVAEKNNLVTIKTNQGTFISRKIVVTAGKGTNDLLGNIENNKLSFPINYERPQKKYYYPSKNKIKNYLPENFPVFAYTDVGIYGHPIFDIKKGAVKVAYFVPVGMNKNDSNITCVEEFIKECLPELKDCPSEEIKDADNCWYDTVSDDDFILGKLPLYENIVIGTGWRGTGYKFAPLVGKILAQLALQNGTVYDIKQFTPARFIK